MSLCCLSLCHVFFTKTTNIYISAKNDDNDTKPSGYDPWGPPRSYMVSRTTLSSMSPVWNPQCPPSTPLLDPPSWQTSNWHINTKFSGYLPRDKKTLLMMLGMTLSSMSLVRNPQMSSKYPPSWPPLPDTLLIEISIQTFQGIFLGVRT